MKTTLNLDNDPELGKYSWRGEIFATDFATQRALVFPIQEQTFSVVDEVDLELPASPKKQSWPSNAVLRWKNASLQSAKQSVNAA